MKVFELKTKKIIEVNPGYGARLIEQGMAILPPAAPASPKMEKGPQKEQPKERKKG